MPNVCIIIQKEAQDAPDSKVRLKKLINNKKLPLTEGPIVVRMTLFALPIMMTGILQILYTMADNIIVGQFSGDTNALGAVGSTSTLNSLILTLLLGISIGTSVVVAQAYGAKNERVVSRAVHTALTFSLIGGVAFMIVGLALSRAALVLMGTRPVLLEGAVLYFRIICLGIPATAVYNFSAGILRSIGDSKTPLIILASTGLVNVVLNIFFVCACGMSVEGVAIATVVSQYLSAFVAVYVLWRKRSECYGFSFKKICIDTRLLKRILRLGVPSGLQSAMFSVSNILLVSGINTLGDHAIKANTIAGNIDAITYLACNAFSAAVMTFVGQNYGAGKIDRVKRSVISGIVQVAVFGIVIGQLQLLFANQLASLYIAGDDPNRAEILALTEGVLILILNVYFICGLMDVMAGALKGLGYSLAPMIISIICICGVRIVWRYVAFPLEIFNSIEGIYISYPISWSLAFICYLVLYIIARVKIKKRLNLTAAAPTEEKTTVEV